MARQPESPWQLWSSFWSLPFRQRSKVDRDLLPRMVHPLESRYLYRESLTFGGSRKSPLPSHHAAFRLSDMLQRRGLISRMTGKSEMREGGISTRDTSKRGWPSAGTQRTNSKSLCKCALVKVSHHPGTLNYRPARPIIQGVDDLP